MTVNSGYFATTPVTEYTETTYNSDRAIRYSNGVCKDTRITNSDFDYGDELEVTAQAVPDLSVLVGTGRIDINGYWCYVDTDYTVSITANASGMSRIDRIVAHLDTSSKTITIIASTGTPASSPVAPSLTRSGSVFEMSLAQISVPNADSAIQDTQITDERSTVSLCGYSGSIPYFNEQQTFYGGIKSEGNIDVSDNYIKNVTDPSENQDAATKSYIDQNQTPAGSILLWYDTSGNVPSGWHACDGTNGTPDLRNVMVMGAGSTYAQGTTGGEATHTLSIAELPVHNHWLETKSMGSTTGNRSVSLFGDVPESAVVKATENTGSGDAHNNLPPYYALFYIMKL